MTKSRFNEIEDVITTANESKLTTRLGKKNVTLKDAENLLEDVISGKINKKKAKSMYNNIAKDANKLKKLNPTESRKKVLLIFKQLQEIFLGPKADEEVDYEAYEEVDDEIGDKTDEQPDTTDMPGLESEESAAQR